MTPAATDRRPIPHWPGRMVDLGAGERVWVAQTPRFVPDHRTELVIMVHGMSGAATNWTDLMGELTPDYDCTALDLPGSGFSPPPRRRSGYRVRALARTVIRLIGKLTAQRQDRRVHLIGNSMGGAVCVRAAAARPDLVRTLTLISPAMPDRRPHLATAHFPVIALPVAGEWLIRRYTSRYTPEQRVAGVYQTCLYDAGVIHEDRAAADIEALRRRDGLGYDAASLVGAARTLTLETLAPRGLSLWRAAERVTAPALVLFGSNDRLVSPDLAATAERAFRQGRVLVLPETGHIAQMEHPALVAAHFRKLVAVTRAAGNARQPNPVDA